MARVVNRTVPVTSDSTVRRVAGSNQCQLEQTVFAGQGGLNKTTASGRTSAGFIPLVMSSKMNSKRRVVDSANGTSRYAQDWSCTVGATAPASTSIPNMAGEQTEVLCHLSFVSVPVPPQDQVFFWYSAAGCFMQDPNR